VGVAWVGIESHVMQSAGTGGEPETGGGPDLEAAWSRLEGLIDWERRERKPGKRGQAMRVDLEPVRALAAVCGVPAHGQRFVHVSGTKGKGSVAALIAAGLGAAGIETLRYGSPHVERLHERLVMYSPVAGGGVRGREVADAELARGLHQALDAREVALAARAERPDADHPGAEATWFDVLTCAALVVMRELKLEWGVFECGLGGRLDSTNLIHGEVCVLTNVDLEHTEVLGDTRAAIAQEKVAIVEPGATLVTGVRAEDPIADVLEAHVAATAGAELVRPAVVGASGQTLAAENLALARAALDALGAQGVLGGAVHPGRLSGALLTPGVVPVAALPGRLEVLDWEGLTVVLDGAHVPSSLAAVLGELGARPGFERPPVVVFGSAKDKDTDGLLKVLAGHVDRLVCTSVGSQTAAPSEELVQNATRHALEAQSASSPRIALDQARALCSEGDWLLVTGSLHLIGAVRPLVRPTPPPHAAC